MSFTKVPGVTGNTETHHVLVRNWAFLKHGVLVYLC